MYSIVLCLEPYDSCCRLCRATNMFLLRVFWASGARCFPKDQITNWIDHVRLEYTVKFHLRGMHDSILLQYNLYVNFLHYIYFMEMFNYELN